MKSSPVRAVKQNLKPSADKKLELVFHTSDSVPIGAGANECPAPVCLSSFGAKAKGNRVLIARITGAGRPEAGRAYHGQGDVCKIYILRPEPVSVAKLWDELW